MDFKRIQIIFLVTFIVIDVFLFSLLRRNQNVQTENLNSDNSTSIVAEMHNDQISFNRQPSNHSGSGYYLGADKNDQLRSRVALLNNQNAHDSHLKLQSTFKQPVALNSSEPHLTVNHLLDDPTFVSFGSHYHYSYDLSTPRTLVYVQRFAGQPIFSNSAEIRFHVADHMLNGYTQSYVSQVHNLREKAATLSARKALAILYQYNNIPNDTKIRWEHFAYIKLLSVKGHDVYLPTWVVALKSPGSSRLVYKYVNAFNGSVINLNNQREALRSATRS